MKKVDKKVPRITMRVSILAVFLSLVLSAFAVVLAYLEYENKGIVKELSEDVMQEKQNDLNSDVKDFFGSAENLVLTGSKLVSSADQISTKSEQLLSYMLSAIKYYPNVAMLYIAIENGDFILAGNLALVDQSSFFSGSSVPLPKGAAYNWEIRQSSGDSPKETYTYFDKNLNKLSSRELHPNDVFDPRKRPWYKGAIEKKSLYWTDVYTFFETKNPGISVALPLYDSQGKILGAMGADLSFKLLSNFFSKQKIRENGRPFILDSKGDVIIPTSGNNRFSTISQETVSKAFQTYQKEKQSNFSFNMNGSKYLCTIEPFPLKAEDKWLMALIVPQSDFFSVLEAMQRSVIIMVIAILIVASMAVIYLAKKLSTPIVLLAKEVDRVRQLDFSSEERVKSKIKEIFLMDEAVALMRSAMHSFTCYIPKEIIRGLFSQHKEIKLGGEKIELTVLFSDIEKFTSIMEEQPTEELMPLLAEYLDSLSKIILEEQGTIDKYIGDCIMAFWGAPTPLPDHVTVAAKTALRCKAFVREFNQRNKEKNRPLFKTRFGINSGVAIVGNVGTPERMNYTLIGDMVNTASRFQSMNKDYGTTILIGDVVHQKLGEKFLTRPIDVVTVRGRKEKTSLYELVAMREGPADILATAEELDLCTRFSTAFGAMHGNQKFEAIRIFEALAKDFPDDRPTRIYLKKLS